ncbi:MAG TPA: 30S ribosomal protein S12 methylthiotransferase RimO [Bdellovibrionales bacterium]|nr:30S ribosomal protein S12 methylthiotransferase RimO [Bdellovibrionales bacterium]
MKEIGNLTKRVHFVSLGCPKNLVDSEIMAGSLMRDGYQVVGEAEDADTVIVNTCGFIDASKQESLDKIMEMAELKKKGLLQKVVVAGCLTQRYKDDLVEGLPEADLFVGSGQFQNIAKILRDSKAGAKEKRFFHLPTYLQEDATPRVNSQPRHRAYLKISEGCKKRCAFCAIPLIRGNLQSRNLSGILGEAKLLVAGGVKELIVVSHDFTDFGWDLRKQNQAARETPDELLRALADESGAEWIRVLYLYPDGVSKETLDLIGAKRNLVKYFDMPLQHINNDMLKAMNRRMARAKIEGVLKDIRDRIPEATLRTQFIVGYPGETEAHFEEMLRFVEEMQFDRVGCFMYSQEEGTKAGTLPDQIDEETKQRRHDTLMAVQKEISAKRHRALIGRRMEVLVEGVSEETELLLVGRHSQQAPDIDGVTYINDGQAEIGQMVQVEITEAMDYDLVGGIVPSDGPQ